MLITKVEQVNKKKSFVYVDEKRIGAFYIGEIKRLHLEKGKKLEKDEINHLNQLLYQRAKERALFLIQKTEQTTEQIRKKLKMNYYSDEVIEQVINFLEEYRFLDDERYIKQFVSCKENKYSIRVIKEKLMQKGIDKKLIDSVLKDLENKEEEVILKIIEKKQKKQMIMSYEEKNKLIQHLLYKGFNYSMIKDMIEKYQKIKEKEA